jgi:natural product biosynthesis luciferase-like monooxygenase protein
VSPTKLLADLLYQGLQLWVSDGELRYRAAQGALTPELRAELASHKADVIALLGEGRKHAPLSSTQHRLWFLHQLEPASTAYSMQRVYQATGPLDLAALEHGFGELVRRHDILRTTFIELDGRPAQVVTGFVPPPMEVVDLRALSPEQRERETRRLCAEDVERPFDLAAGPLFRFRVLRLAEEEHLVLRTVHHIAIDGWSSRVLLRELLAFYQSALANKPAALPALGMQYADFAVWQRAWMRGEVLEQQLTYWKERLAGAAPALELPTDHPRPIVQSFHGAHESLRLSPRLTESLKALSQREGATLFMTLLAAFQTLLFRYSGQEDISVGSPIANRGRAELEELIGFFANTLVHRGDLSGNPTFRELLGRVRESALSAYANQDVPFELLVERLQPERSLGRSPLFQVLFTLENAPTASLKLGALTLGQVEVESVSAKFDLTLTMVELDGQLIGALEYNTDLFEAETVTRMLRHFEVMLEAISTGAEQRISALPMLTPEEREQLLVEWNATKTDFARQTSLPTQFEAQAERTPEAVALSAEEVPLTYRELNRRANQLAHHLRGLGVGPEVLVGLCVERSLEMVIGMLAIHKAGGAYLPIDPTYPKQRLAFILGDARVKVLITQTHLASRLPGHGGQEVLLDPGTNAFADAPSDNPVRQEAPGHLAYVIYTSGSTGNPKGVKVLQGNLTNFLESMDAYVGLDTPGNWLAVTNVTFDISILELLWPLARGFKVVLQAAPDSPLATAAPLRHTDKPLQYSLFYFADDEEQGGADRYRLLLEGAKFADRHGFTAVWTPERHFHSFGGLYPNPSVASAAVAAVTERIRIRAGSVVLPLHSPIRVAEEWALVDNLSRGRVDVSFASGWHADDFVFQPENYASRKEVMFRDIDVVRRLWRGESVSMPGGTGKDVAVRIRPRPIQAELPVWITAAGNPETFRQAGERGANILTHLLGQNLEELTEKIAVYRAAYRASGHGPGAGHVTLMAHTFIGPDIEYVKEKVRRPFCNYLKSSVDLLRNLARGLGQDFDAMSLSEDAMDKLLSHAFDRYFETSALFGTPSSCLRMIDTFKGIGVDEVGCLIDFGVDYDSVMSNLSHLDTLRKRTSEAGAAAGAGGSVLDQLQRHEITHLQCTPSMMQMLVANTEVRQALSGLKKLLLGGEALPAPLAEQLRAATPAQLYNMYGPTETTIWSAAHLVTQVGDSIPIGRPIANTRIYILDAHHQLVPVGVPGELYIGGTGVSAGYLNRPELTAERFIPDPFGTQPEARLYRTGDLARYRPDGTIEFHGRVDHQVKLRGFRVELGEVEAALLRHTALREAVAVVREDTPGDARLVAYFVASTEARPTAVQLRAHMKEHLPDYMVPSLFVALDALPLTKSGKVDRRMLPSPSSVRSSPDAGFVMPQTEAERHIATVWQEVLRVERVGLHDNFFDLGGHSLLLVKMHRKLAGLFEAKVTLFDLFRLPTVHALAQYIGRDQDGAEAARQAQAETRISRTESTTRLRQSRQQHRAARRQKDPADE